MKQYAKSIIYFAFPLIIGSLCACRSAKSRIDRTQTDMSLSQLERIEHNVSGTISSQVKTKETEKGNTWRIVCNFDTSPDSPRHQVSRSKGARRRHTPLKKIMSLHEYRIICRNKMPSTLTPPISSRDRQIMSMLLSPELTKESEPDSL